MQRQLQNLAYSADPDMSASSRHQPVLVREVINFLQPERGGVFIDGTVGVGGHSWAMLVASPHCRVIGLDRDESALRMAVERLSQFGSRFSAIHANFKELAALSEAGMIPPADGILVDLGISSHQLDDASRGFSFQQEGPLDMRMDRRQQLTAADLVNSLSEVELANLIFQYGEDPLARRLARAIVRQRQHGRIETTTQLASIILKASGGRGRWRIHPATRTFQALRIAVNDELSGLDTFVATAIRQLKPGGRFVAITFHSLEDRIIKQSLRFHAGQCQCRPPIALSGAQCPGCGAGRRVQILTRKPVVPSAAEISLNPRARSAKLRACCKLSGAEH